MKLSQMTENTGTVAGTAARSCDRLIRLPHENGDVPSVSDYAGKLTKTAASALDGEQLLAAVKVFPQGHTKKKIGGAMFGAVGALTVASGKKDGHAIGTELLPVELALGLTETRGFVFALSKMTGKATLPPLRILPRSFVAAVASARGRTLHVTHTRIWLRLADGSELALETAGGHAENGNQFVEELSKTAKVFSPPAGSSTANSPSPAASWQPDPTARHQLRYWDGKQWTDHVSDDGTTGLDTYSDDPSQT